MKVRVNRDISGATYGHWNLRKGDEIELEASQAKDFIAQGYAEEVKRKRARRGASGSKSSG